MIYWVKRLLKIRIIRYGLVGGVGIPVNELALLLFLYGFNLPYFIASACAFEVSNIVNFVLNQMFTYREQLGDIHGFEWVRRAARGQLASLSAMLVAYIAGEILVYVLHVNPYIANPAGIVIQFGYNFFISNKLVFRPVQSATEAPISN